MTEAEARAALAAFDGLGGPGRRLRIVVQRLLQWAAGFRAAAWGCVALLAVLSLLPAEEMVHTGLSNLIEHAAAHAGTALLAGLGYRERRLGWIGAALVAYAGALLGIWLTRFALACASSGEVSQLKNAQSLAQA